MNKEDLKIVFFGTPEFAVESLDALVKNGFNVAAVVTMPDKASGRGQKVSYSAVKKYALEHSLPLLQPEKLKDEAFVQALRDVAADLFIVIAFRMLPEVVWAMPPLGTFNLHGSLLPRYRGAAPINRAIMNGDAETGVTTFFLKHEIDTGDIIDRVSIEVGPNENAGSVHDRLMMLGAELTVKTVESILNGTLTTRPQSSFTDEAPTPAPKIFKEDCRIDWTLGASQLHNHVRGLAPYPAAWTDISFEGPEGEHQYSVKVLETRIADECKGLEAGKLVLQHKKVYCGTGDGTSLELVTVQPSGKRPMPAADFIRGLRPEEKGLNLWFV
ncbi:MAG: methionyl-tRNA formyltransferase [Bacteroidales bacterium]|nr:methionyl-tRNA formyltransferase [Bacteroidales bacterium]